ncbi:MAG: hypothetical protein J6I49_08665 [Bacteroidales bacterium]|nr:hypothetical protein [Bacteroidales bacterium]
MKHLATIAIAATTLIITLFWSGGVGVMTCACSGRTTLVIPLEDGCCGGQSDCMSVRVLQISENETIATLQVPGDLPLPALLPAVGLPAPCPAATRVVSPAPLRSHSGPPPGARSMVMRV